MDYLRPAQTLDLCSQTDSTAQWMAAQGQALHRCRACRRRSTATSSGRTVSAIRARSKLRSFRQRRTWVPDLVLAELGTLGNHQPPAHARAPSRPGRRRQGADDLAQSSVTRSTSRAERCRHPGRAGRDQSNSSATIPMLKRPSAASCKVRFGQAAPTHPKQIRLHSAVTEATVTPAPPSAAMNSTQPDNNWCARRAYQQPNSNGATSAMVSKLTGWSLDRSMPPGGHISTSRASQAGGWHDGSWAMQLGEQGRS